MGKFSYDDEYLQIFFSTETLHTLEVCVFLQRHCFQSLGNWERRKSRWMRDYHIGKCQRFFSLFDDAAVASSILLPLQISNHYYVKNGKSLKKSSNYILSMEKMTWSVDHIILLFSVVRIFLITWISNFQILEFWHALSSCLAKMKISSWMLVCIIGITF